MKHISAVHYFLLAASLLLLQATHADGLGTAFTYQGLLDENGSPANGNYDVVFAIYNVPTNGMAVATSITNLNVGVTNGIVAATLDFGGALFDGTAYWLELSIRKAGTTNDYSVLAPRQPVRATPYALYAPKAGSALNADTAQLAQAIRTPDGAIYTDVVAAINGLRDGVTLAQGTNIVLTTTNNTVTISATGVPGPEGKPGSATNAWNLAGNADTHPSVDFLGTTDATPLAFRINNTEALRLETNGNVSLGTQGSSYRMTIATRRRDGIVFAGATQLLGIFNDSDAGDWNPLTQNGDNLIMWKGADQADDTNAGGLVIGPWSSAAHGLRVTPSGDVGIGTAQPSERLDVAGTIKAYSIVASYLKADTVHAGVGCVAGDAYDVIVGGANNYLGTWPPIFIGFPLFPGQFPTLNGYNSIVGGHSNSIEYGNTYSTITGGEHNTIKGDADFSMIHTFQKGSYNTIGGGHLNSIWFGTDCCTVAGGEYNRADGVCATIPGGSGNLARGANSFAAGRYAQALHDNSFVWSDGTHASTTTASNRFVIYAQNGVGINTAPTGSGAALEVNGTVQASVITITSDREAKKDFKPIDRKDILERLVTLPIHTWSFKSDSQTRHIGPVAQDFKAAFGLGTDERHIATVDADGIALAGIQELVKELAEKEARMQHLESDVLQLKAMLQALSGQSHPGGN